MNISWEDSQKILKLLAAISTKEHAIQIVERNKEALESGTSEINCPHCEFRFLRYQCGKCLWTYAIEKVLGTLESYDCPCINVKFLEEENNIPSSIELSWNELTVDSREEDGGEKWLEAHIEWASKEEDWEIQDPPRGYRTSVLKE